MDLEVMIKTQEEMEKHMKKVKKFIAVKFGLEKGGC